MDDCDFVGGGVGFAPFDPTGDLTVKNSRLDAVGAVCMCVSTDSVVIENCIATDVRSGIHIQQGSSGVIRNVDVHVTSSSGTGLGLEMGGSAEVYDSRFEGGWCGVY